MSPQPFSVLPSTQNCFLRKTSTLSSDTASEHLPVRGKGPLNRPGMAPRDGTHRVDGLMGTESISSSCQTFRELWVWVALFLPKIEFLLPNCASVVVPQVCIKGSYFPFKLFFTCRCCQGHCCLHHEESPLDTGDRYVSVLLNEPVLLRNN